MTTAAAPLRLFGRVTLPVGATFSVRVPFAGFVRTVEVGPGDAVEKGSVLAVFQSKDAVDLAASIAQAGAEHSVSVAHRAHLEALHADGVVSDAEVRAAVVRVERDRLAHRRLLDAGAVVDLEPGSPSRYRLRSPRAGRVLTRGLAPGEHAGPSDPKAAFVVADLSTLEVVATAYERDVSRLAVGLSARVSFPGSPGLVVVTQVTGVGDVIDPVNRTLDVRLRVPADLGLRPEMAAQVVLDPITPATPTVPSGAVVLRPEGFVVLVKGSGGSFERRSVTVGPVLGDRVVVLAGLGRDDEVVVDGALLIDASLTQ